MKLQRWDGRQGIYQGQWCMDEDVAELEDENAALQAECDRLTAMLGPIEHPDDIAVDGFAKAMKDKLAKKREEGRSGWEDADPQWLAALLVGHVQKGDPVDIANFCMMLYHHGDKTSLGLAWKAAMLGPQKPMSAEEVTKPGWYWVRNTRCPYWKLRYVAPALGKGGTVVGFQFVGPLKAPEV